MSFSNSELETYCDEIILKRAAIDRSCIVLCEGFSDDLKTIIKSPPATLKNNFSSQFQDASFYQRSLPKWWRKTGNPEPIFYVCGKQKTVIKAYFYLRNKYQEKNDKRLDSNKIYALIDIDTQKHTLPKTEKYPFCSLEAIYADLYNNGIVNLKTAKNHKIWVTGLLHKEAYYLVPELEGLFKSHQPKAIFNNQDINNLNPLYQKIAQSISRDKNFYTLIKENFPLIKERIKYNLPLYESESVDDFQKTWLENFSNPNVTTNEKINLINILLIMAKSKTTWENIKSSNENKSSEHKKYRNQLSFKIALEFYAKQPQNSQHHLPSFFNALLTTYE
ncbi:MAG: hypothetical protein KAU26_03450 [Methylococcales bacterium]|nr:hypothetical protein [Methylococcales bacterium]